MDEFSVYNIPLEYYTDWWLIQPTLPLIVSVQQGINCQLPCFLMEDDKCNRRENESNRPVSAYALFFRERQAVVKIHWPDTSFGHISKIVAAQWEALTRDEKESYRKRSEISRRRQIKMAAIERVRRICGSADKKNEPKANDSGINKK